MLISKNVEEISNNFQKPKFFQIPLSNKVATVWTNLFLTFNLFWIPYCSKYPRCLCTFEETSIMCGTYPSNLFHISRRIIVASSTDGTQITSKGGGTTRHTQNIVPMLKGDTHTLCTWVGLYTQNMGILDYYTRDVGLPRTKGYRNHCCVPSTSLIPRVFSLFHNGRTG